MLTALLKPLIQSAIDGALPTAKTALKNLIASKMPATLGVEGQMVVAIVNSAIDNWTVKI